MVAAALLILAAGLVWRVFRWLRRPDPSRIVLTPAPATRFGVALRVAAEILVFRSLYRADRPCWGLSMLLHGGLGLILIWHLGHFLFQAILPLALVQTGGAAVLAGALGLGLRRVAAARMRAVSVPSDYLHLLLLAALAGAGLGGLGHGGLAALLFALFPFSKLLHGPAAFMAGTRGRRGP